MNKYCKGCIHHYSAGHPKGSHLAKKYNNWCVAMGAEAVKIGHCKQHKLRANDSIGD